MGLASPTSGASFAQPTANLVNLSQCPRTAAGLFSLLPFFIARAREPSMWLRGSIERKGKREREREREGARIGCSSERVTSAPFVNHRHFNGVDASTFSRK
jgi:hypothetical protein